MKSHRRRFGHRNNEVRVLGFAQVCSCDLSQQLTHLALGSDLQFGSVWVLEHSALCVQHLIDVYT